MSEAFVLRSYPYRESDLIVSFFTRDQGKLRGVARRARRPKGGFGAGLERLSQVRISYYQRETVELVKVDNCELIQSQFALSASYPASVTLDYIAEVSDQLSPASEPNERFYRLLAAVLAELRTAPEAALWRVVLYFTYWAVRLAGFLPALRVSASSRELAGEISSLAIAQLSERAWDKNTASDLRRFLVREIEGHLERRLVTIPLLESL